MKSKKILFYYHHFGGLGHGTRILSICKALKTNNQNYKIIVINSGKPQPELKINKYATIINLPYFKADRSLFSGLNSKEDINVTFEKRRNILNKIANIFKPDITIFEHFPFGRSSLEKELIPFIKKLRQDNCKIYSSVRDIIEQKEDIERLKENLKLFEGVLVHSDKDMGFITSFKQPSILKEKIIFTGRIIPKKSDELINKNKIREQLKCENKKLIVVSIGGGIDGYKIINKLIDVKKDLDKKLNTLILITTGPSIDFEIFEKLKNKVGSKKDILITKFNPNYLDYVNAADLSISMGGYNSINNALLTNTKTIIFPRQSDEEQKKRAEYFSKYFEVLDYKTISNEELFSKIIENISKTNNLNYNGLFDGGGFILRFLDYVLNLDLIKIRLTTDCNLNCDMCSWKKSKRNYFTFNQAKQLISQASLFGINIINFTGGEPTLHPKIEELLKYCKSLNLKTSLSTNGVIPPSKLSSLIKFLDYADISLDSYNKKIHDKIRGYKGAFENTKKTIQILSNNKIKVHINVTVRPDNFNSIHKIIPTFPFINSISFTLVDSTFNQLDYLIFKKEELEDFYFNELIRILKECALRDIKVRINPFFREFENTSPKEILLKILFNKEKYINDFNLIFQNIGGKCNLAKHHIRANSYGNISPCCFLDDIPLTFGNLYETNLSSIIMSDRYFNFITNAEHGKGECKFCKQGYRIYENCFK